MVVQPVLRNRSLAKYRENLGKSTQIAGKLGLESQESSVASMFLGFDLPRLAGKITGKLGASIREDHA
jgi:hypothetical protein